MTNKPQKEINKDINKLRKKYGKTPLKELKTYKQRLDDQKTK